MAATTAGALKALLGAQGLGIPVYRAPAPTEHPADYITISDGITITPDLAGDFGDQAAQELVSELVQVDVWQRFKDLTVAVTNPPVVESFTLIPTVLRALHGAALTTAPTHVYGCTVDSSVRIPEYDTNTIHTAITVRLRRVL